MGWSILSRKHRRDEATRETIVTADRAEAEKMARLERAEAEVAGLRIRADNAIQFLDARRKRNHWRESIEQMIQGA